MNIEFTPDVEQYIAEKLATGEFSSADEVINDAIRSKIIDEETGWDRATLIEAIKKGIADADAGRMTKTSAKEIWATMRRQAETT